MALLISIILQGCLQADVSKLYDKCVQACDANKTCLEYEVVSTNTRIGYARKCIKYSDAPCKITCVEKYK